MKTCELIATLGFKQLFFCFSISVFYLPEITFRAKTGYTVTEASKCFHGKSWRLQQCLSLFSTHIMKNSSSQLRLLPLSLYEGKQD